MKNQKSAENIARDYHVASRNLGAFKRIANAHQRNYTSEIQELVTNAPLRLNSTERIGLPSPSELTMSVGDAITSRTSKRQFNSGSLSTIAVSTLLYYGNGIRTIYGDGKFRNYQRNVPNSGNLGSVETYAIISNVSGLKSGIFHFDSLKHELVSLRTGTLTSFLREFVFYQEEFTQAPLILVLTSSIGRLMKKYDLRGYRLALLDVGHVSQNIYLAATAMHLPVCATAGFIDDEMDETLGIDGIESAAMLVIAVGGHIDPAHQ